MAVHGIETLALTRSPLADVIRIAPANRQSVASKLASKKATAIASKARSVGTPTPRHLCRHRMDKPSLGPVVPRRARWYRCARRAAMTDTDTVPIIVDRSVTKQGPERAGCVLVAGSHGGVFAGFLAAKAGCAP
jgi:hypothetical protein